MSGEPRGRGRPALAWPSGTAGCRQWHRARHLTRGLVDHCRTCTHCWHFHSKRYDRARWCAALDRQPNFKGRPCGACGSSGRRVNDGQCYACWEARHPLNRDGLLPGKRGDGSSRPGRAEWLRKAHEKADKGTPFATATATGPGMGGRLWRVDGTQYGDGQKHITIRPADGGRGGLDDEHFERHDRYRTPQLMDIFGTALEEVLNTLDRRAQEYRHLMNEQPSA